MPNTSSKYEVFQVLRLKIQFVSGTGGKGGQRYYRLESVNRLFVNIAQSLKEIYYFEDLERYLNQKFVSCGHY